MQIEAVPRSPAPAAGGLPTDRLVAEWYLDSDRVNGVLEGGLPVAYEIEERILVPAAMRVLGRAAWYAPRPLRRVYTRVALTEA